MNRQRTAAELEREWTQSPRWSGIRRDYTADDVARLRGSLHVEHTLARRGAERLWQLFGREPYVHALAARLATRPCRWPRPA